MAVLPLICWADYPGIYLLDIRKPKIHVPHPLLEVECGSGHRQVNLVARKPFAYSGDSDHLFWFYSIT